MATKDKVKLRASQQRWIDKNKEKNLEYMRNWAKEDRKKNPEKYRQRDAQQRIKHAERIKLYNKKWRTEHPAVYDSTLSKFYRIKYKYGITREEYEKMILDQNGLCGVCGVLMRVPNVDHCHETGKVRGLLCVHCNSGLGSFSDDVNIMRQAIKYLDKAEDKGI
jgi:hypothetical protein